jgi:hypothetical protein
MMVQLFRKDTPITEKVKILLPKILLTGFNLKSTMKKKKDFVNGNNYVIFRFYILEQFSKSLH